MAAAVVVFVTVVILLVVLLTHHGNLNADDKRLLTDLYLRSSSVFEWGVGESTTLAANAGVRRYTGVDGSQEWLGIVQPAIPRHFRLVWADIGDIGEYSYPIDEESRAKWPAYSRHALESESEGFDVYFVDGRFRVACVAQALMHASQHGRDPTKFVVVVHDYVTRKDRYADLFRVVRFAHGSPHSPTCTRHGHAKLAVFRRRDDVSDEEIYRLWHRHRYDVG